MGVIIQCVISEAKQMIQTVEAVIDEHGNVRLLGEVKVSGSQRALVTVLDESIDLSVETALLAEKSLAKDWLRPEEDAAWAYLQPTTL